MKKIFSLILFCFISVQIYSQVNRSNISIIPMPVFITENIGQFVLPHNIIIQADKTPEVNYVISYLKNRLLTATGSNINIINDPLSSSTVKLILNRKADTIIGKEGYHLEVTEKNITIKANKPAGLFYGVQTLLQLFPKEIENNVQVKKIEWTLPCVTIKDYPRFGWRGLMFDVARHFFTKKEVEQYIDVMAHYKYNLLHLHLTDNEGWRIEIKGLPKLTEVGAWNVKKVGTFGNFTPPAENEPRTYGGYYTQKDIKDIVEYAKARFVNILPEIDVPGHSLAAVSSYPELLSCTPGADKYRVSSGESNMDWSKSPPKLLVDNTLCPANENVYIFLDTVLTQISQLFPFDYIHIGGDECVKDFWKKSEAVKSLMKRKGLKDIEDVQWYFEKRLQKIVKSKGKKLIGWDEIVDAGLSSDAAVMSWRGVEGGIAAAKMKHKVVMSPSTFAYLDFRQGDAIMEPPIYAALSLSQAYKFDPLPGSVDPKYILGGQANLWTEQIYNFRQVEYMTWPRGFAISESLWSPKERKDWNNFFSRVEKHFERFNIANIKYAPSVYDAVFNVKKMPDNQLQIELSTEVEGLDIYYSFDNSYPDRFYPKYAEPLVAPEDASLIRVITYRNNQPIGRMMNMPIDVLKSRIATP